MKKITTILTTLILSSLFLSSCTNIETKETWIQNNNITNITQNLTRVWVNQFKTNLSQNDYTLIDLRTTNELKDTWIISWATQIDFYNSNFKTNISKLDKNEKYLIYCRSGNRSWNTLSIMKNLWFTNVVELNSWINWWLRAWESTDKY